MYLGVRLGRFCTKSVFDEEVVTAGCLDDFVGGRDPPRAGPQPDVLLMRIKPLGCRGAEARSTGANRTQPLVESCPGPRLDLGVARLGLGARRFQVFEPCIGLFDLQQLFRELDVRHRRSLPCRGRCDPRTRSGRTSYSGAGS